jgi:peptidoglycan/xylan/chitin deacetylase (PgdA/CDA1 family)
MKEVTSTITRKKFRVRESISALVVFGIVLAYPAFSLMQVGGFFRSSDNRSAATLPVMTHRSADKTQLPAQLFQEPLITVTFDDGFESIYKTALPLLQKYGIHTTQYIIAGRDADPFYVSWAQVARMQDAGHEIGCHTMTHTDLTTLSDANLDTELSQCKSVLSSHFGPITDFASPYGAADARTTGAVTKYFDSQRNTNGDPTNGVTAEDINLASNFDRYNIIGVTVKHNTTVEELDSLVDFARKNNGWLVLTYHQADDDTGSHFAVNSSSMDKQFSYLSKTNVRIVTMHDALQATRLQNV